jgi:nucleotide-binding universal stress UspA family protein
VDIAKIADGNAEFGQHGIAISAEGCRWRVARGSISFHRLPLLRSVVGQKPSLSTCAPWVGKPTVGRASRGHSGLPIDAPLIRSPGLFTLCFHLKAHDGASNGGAMVWDRLLCAIDQFESGQSALDFAAGLAATNDSSIRVFHIRELSRMARVMPLETPLDAEEFVRDAVFSLGQRNVAAEGRFASALEDQVARRIVEEAISWECKGIVLGSRRVRGIARLSGRGVRERVLRLSTLPVLVAPAATSNGIYWPPRLRSEGEQSGSDRNRHPRRRSTNHGTREPGIR